ncbi:hypothetical protein WL1483_2177 [Aeromonas schubertii]|uniref:Uncharacterized protein n=1 Tax=Aeromonas schubertii TaxID=652 RepID=A0A0S2SIQ6_9GAMM|nr:hypothetical protein WL1483_2177 [Aeromonas schubertii]
MIVRAKVKLVFWLCIGVFFSAVLLGFRWFNKTKAGFADML